MHRQLAPTLSTDWLRGSGATVLGCDGNHALKGCAVLWDQQAFKQVFVAQYSRRVALLRQLYNGYAKATGRIALPAVGQTLDQSFLAFLAAEDEDQLTALIEDALHWCPTLILTGGSPARLPGIDRLIHTPRATVYRPRLYGVDLLLPTEWDNRIVWPEVALL